MFSSDKQVNAQVAKVRWKMCARIKWNALPKIWIAFRVFSYSWAVVVVAVVAVLLQRLLATAKSKGNNNASHLAWCVIRNVAISFTHLASCINAIAICCAILSTHWCLCVSQRWSTCTSTPKQKRTMNKKYTQRQQRWAPKYLVPMPHVYAFLLFTTTNAYTWRYIWGEVNRFLVSTFTPFALSRSMVSQMEKKETRTHHCLGCVLLSLRNACFGFNSDQVSW